MQSERTLLKQFPALTYAPFYTHLLHLGVGLTFTDTRCQLLRYVYAEHLRKHREMRHLGDRLQTRNDRYVDSRCPTTLHETEIFLIVEKHLGNEIIRAILHLLLHVVYVGFHVGSLLMFLRIARHAIRKRSLNALNPHILQPDTLIEEIYLLLEVGGVFV